jgi:hypothetical protein
MSDLYHLGFKRLSNYLSLPDLNTLAYYKSGLSRLNSPGLNPLPYFENDI